MGRTPLSAFLAAMLVLTVGSYEGRSSRAAPVSATTRGRSPFAISRAILRR